MFQKHKQDFLKKADKSEKGQIDKDVVKLINKINKKENYYTTSSCSGRIEIFEETGERSVNKLFVNHDLIEFNQDFFEKIKKAVKKTKNKVWFKQESLILHVCCKTMDDAIELLKIAREIGLKRSGVISLSSGNSNSLFFSSPPKKVRGEEKNLGKSRKEGKITVEIINPEHLLAIVGENRNLIVDELYFKKLINEANLKLKRNREKIKELYGVISQ